MGRLPYKYDDGGRAAAGFHVTGGDCVTRAVAIATGLPYREIYERMAEGNLKQRRSSSKKNVLKEKNVTGKFGASHGVNHTRKWFKTYMKSLGFEWTPTMRFGQPGCHAHLMEGGKLPMGRLCVVVNNHLVAVVDGVIHDAFDPQGGLSPCVFGYWKLKEKHNVLLPVVEVPRRGTVDYVPRDLWDEDGPRPAYRREWPARVEGAQRVPASRAASDAAWRALPARPSPEKIPTCWPAARNDAGSTEPVGGRAAGIRSCSKHLGG